MSRTHNYTKGLITGYAATFTTIAIGLWLTPFTLRFLDREEYAVFALASDLLMWMGLFDIGITAGLIRSGRVPSKLATGESFSKTMCACQAEVMHRR
jgi:O-antigen/teichoic acid export membrane protein